MDVRRLSDKELMPLKCGVGEDSQDCKEIKPVNPKEINPEYLWEGLDAEAEAPILWPPDAKSRLIRKDPDAGKN